MAENEILYVAGASRWRGTRKALQTGESADAIAMRVIDEMNRGLRSSLVTTFRNGATLLHLLRAAGEDRNALRAVVMSFKDRQLARLFSEAIKACGSDRPIEVARFAGNLIIDRVHDRALCYAGQCEAYRNETARHELSVALSTRFDRYRPELMAILKDSMRGHPVRRAPRRSSTRASVQLRVKAVVETSLLPVGSGHRNAVRRH
jgi:hypothetical protein